MKSLIKKIILKISNLIANAFFSHIFLKINEIRTVDRGTQILLSLRYKEMLRKGTHLPGLDEVEFRVFSQNGEDGIL